MTTYALKLVKRFKTSQSLLDEIEYFPGTTRALVEGGEIWILNERGEKNYSRPFRDYKEISVATVQV